MPPFVIDDVSSPEISPFFAMLTRFFFFDADYFPPFSPIEIIFASFDTADADARFIFACRFSAVDFDVILFFAAFTGAATYYYDAIIFAIFLMPLITPDDAYATPRRFLMLRFHAVTFYFSS